MKKLENLIPHEAYGPFLQSAPLYNKSIAFVYSENTDDRLPYLCDQISIYCPKCKKQMLFHRAGSTPGESGATIEIYPEQRFFDIDFECSDQTCRYHKRYFIHRHHEGDQLILTKCGEWPSLSPRVNRVIENTFPESADLLKKGVVCLNEGYGLGAFAYFRQVLENHIETLLTVVEDYAKETDDKITVDKIANLRIRQPMSDKIAIAKDALPAILKVDGLNPLGTIYGCLSEDIHKGTDEECLGKAQAIYTSMVFILETLAQSRKIRLEYAENLKLRLAPKTGQLDLV